MTITFTDDDRLRFQEAESTAEINIIYQDLFSFYELSDGLYFYHHEDFEAKWEAVRALQELQRQAMERFSIEDKKAKAAVEDEDGVSSLKVRNWAMREGIPMNKRGKLSIDVENQYRREHDLPERERKAPTASSKPRNNNSSSAAPSQIQEMRKWLKENNFQVGIKGRIAPELQNEYFKAHDLPLLEVGEKKAGPYQPGETAQIRSWAKENGFEVGLKGKIKPEIIQAYKDTHK